MTNRKNTRRALLMSTISLILCVSMLVGTTFAWFTDEVKSGTNQILAGNLDLEVYNSIGIDESKKVTEQTELFDEITYWEPGVVAYENLTVANLGTLALKYQLAVNFENETVVNGHGLSEALQVAFVPGGIKSTTREGALDEAKEYLAPLASIVENGELLKGENDVYGIVIYWQPDENDNDFNMNNGNKGIELTIDLGIKVLATQLTSEEDGFDKYYDGAANWYGGIDISWYDPDATELTIGSAEELAGLAAIVNGTAVSPVTTYSTEAATIQDSFAGVTIKLASDINLNNVNWTPIGNWNNAFEGTFDGQGHTIHNLYIYSVDENAGSGVGLFGVAQNATIKGITVHNANITGYEMVATIAGSPYSGCTISDCHVTGEINLISEWAYVGGIVGYGYTKVDGCSVIADGTGVIMSKTRNAVGGIAAWLLEDASSITSCQVKNMELTGWANIGAITGFMHRLGVIDGCSAENVVLNKTRQDGHPTIGLASGGWSYNASKAITITNNTFKNITLNGTYLAISSANILYGAEYAGSTNSNFVVDSNAQENITNNLVEVQVIKTTDELKNALTNGGTYALANKVGSEDWTLALTETITVPSGVEVTLYLNGKTIAGTFGGTGNQDMFLVKGDLTVRDGLITMIATQNQGWNAMADIFDITAGGVVTLENVTADVSGTDMNFVAHLNNWGTASLYVNNCDFTTTYVAIRAFNSGYDMNTVVVENTDFHGGRMFWVHNYTSEGKDDSTLSLDIYGNNNTSDHEKPVRFGFSNSVYYNIDGLKIVEDAASLKEALNAGEDVSVNADVNVSKDEAGSNGYGATGIHIGNGQTLDGNGNSVGVNAWSTWDSAINITSGTIKNVTVNSGMRGIFINHNGEAGKVYLENVVIDGTIYTISCDQGTNSGLEANNSTFNGWTSYAATIGDVLFTDCSFGEGQGYAFCRPYAPTTFVGCDFEAGYEIDARAAVTFENCTIGGEPLTAENLGTLVTSNIANATVK